MDPVKKDQRNVIIIFIVLIIVFVSYKIYVDKKNNDSLKNSTTVVAEVKELQHTRGIVIVHIDFFYGGKTVENQFETYNLDSLKIGTKVRIKVSPANPNGHVELVGVVNE